MARVAVALSCTAEQRAELMALARSRTEGGPSGGTSQDCFSLPGRQTERRGWRRVWRATKYGGSVAQALCGSWVGRAAGSRSAGQDPEIWRGFAPAGSAPTGIAAAQGVGQLGWSFSGRSVGRLGRCGLAPAAQGRRSIAPAALLVRQHRPAICGQSRRYYRSLPEPAGKRAGLERRREADDPGVGTRARICPDQQRQDCSRFEKHLQTARHGTVNLFAALEVATGVIRGRPRRPRNASISRPS